MDFRPTEEQDLLRRTVREFAESEIGPHVMASFVTGSDLLVDGGYTAI